MLQPYIYVLIRTSLMILIRSYKHRVSSILFLCLYLSIRNSLLGLSGPSVPSVNIDCIDGVSMGRTNTVHVVMVYKVRGMSMGERVSVQPAIV